ncbi:hypothetical protein [Bacillus wiedmannii]|uniref:hypothetical protein n=1 Tax=Bacillus wiedmannii TaxID=1890302 RepID=UPI000BF123AE|nr:hypothetical protein [Bacillus wiedmannii]PEN51108.1 hypothetical protein CN630_04010 [Bacillus wiedmannii]PEN68034.1 hypothetical protein CN576_01000 [Bacillus wiedmannii]
MPNLDPRRRAREALERARRKAEEAREKAEKVIKDGEKALGSLASDAQEALQHEADSLAINYQKANPNGDFDDCVTVVAAGCAAYGASQGGVVGAAIGAGAGVPAARIACRRVFP